jgi:hypothetical protein
MSREEQRFQRNEDLYEDINKLIGKILNLGFDSLDECLDRVKSEAETEYD